jgi:hypothetical protein
VAMSLATKKIITVDPGEPPDKVYNLSMERNFSRDKHTFRNPGKNGAKIQIGLTNMKSHNNGRINEAQKWDWEGDKRTFILPVESAACLKEMHFVRDVLAVVTAMYLYGGKKDSWITTRFPH